jgi:hypothetical protein
MKSILITMALTIIDGSEESAYRAERAQWLWLLEQPPCPERDDLIALLS